MLLSEAITALATATRADGRSPRTIVAYRESLGQLVTFLGDRDVATITITDLRSYAADLRDRTQRFTAHPMRSPQAGGLSPFSVATRLRTVKRLFNWLTEEGLLATNPAQRLKVPKVPQKEPKAISMETFRRLLAATAGDTPTQLRDRAILLFLGDTGCRVGGLARVRVQDVDLARKTALVMEKGEKTRVVFYVAATAEALRQWLAVRPHVEGDALFVNLGPKLAYAQLTEQSFKEMLRRLKKRAGVTEPVTPHRFRHAFAREYLRKGGDLATLSRILGHASVEVTARFYAVFTSNELQEFHAKHSPIVGLLDEEPDDRTY